MLFVVSFTLKNIYGRFETRVHVFPFIYRTNMLNSVQILKWKSDKKSKQNKKIKPIQSEKQSKDKNKNKNKTKRKQSKDKNKNKNKTKTKTIKNIWKTIIQNIKYHELKTNQCWV